MTDMGFRLRHGGHVEKYERLAQMMVRAESPIAPGVAVTTAPGVPPQAQLLRVNVPLLAALEKGGRQEPLASA